ncbi:inhibitor of growth proteins N-terminal histone-binding-domain-containing protein [Macrophomina phaseolina]|uniref:Chromatin modification-related protein n=1 Tax=Macrophomina phaseolina TaxID=35725 RepID=A0ABQ8FYC8_9PEZI|nr:inhibitor of growth proteins N-terminal histone-binding-domain-containing protein [Macrophomina phaseolina]
MALAEDAASVLELFIHDVANLPAEITHLYEEMQAKEQQIQACNNIIESRDGSLQKFVKLNGSLVKNPKEEPYNKLILQNYDKAQTLQDEKVHLAEKAAQLLDRHVKRLDIKIRDLTNDGSIPHDPQLPSLLRESPGNLVAPASSTATGANTPLNPLSVNAHAGSQQIANAAIARLANATGQGRSMSSPAIGGSGSTVLNQTHMSNASALAAMSANNRQREMSVGSDSKRRRLNASLGALPSASSSLARQSSLGPGTPKAGTPGGSRAGSLGPRPSTKKNTKVILPGKANRKKMGKAGISKKSARRLMGGSRASPSTTGDDESMLSDAEVSDEEASGLGHDGAADDDTMDMDEDADDTQYCICERVSFGDMVACDNPKCEIQWFHWECVGLTQEPKGEWLCPICDPNSKYDKKKKKLR